MSRPRYTSDILQLDPCLMYHNYTQILSDHTILNNWLTKIKLVVSPYSCACGFPWGDN